MARRSQHSFLKRQKELKRKEEAAEKMARRQGKIARAKHSDENEPEAGGTVEGQAEEVGQAAEDDR